MPFAAIVTPDSIVFTAPSGRTHTIASTLAGFEQARALVRRIQEARRTGSENADPLVAILISIASPAQAIEARSQGRVTVRNGTVFYGEVEVHNALTKRIVWGVSEGFDVTPYMAFLDQVMENPSHRAIEQLWNFVERHKMGITDDGYLLAYKRVRSNYHDIYTGKFDNSPGQVVCMPRREVNDDPNQTCSSGLHACSQSYLPHYGMGSGNTVVIVKIDPADVVSVPYDYVGKMRVCRYVVLSEYSEADKDDLLASKPVFATSQFRAPVAPSGQEPDPVAAPPAESHEDAAEQGSLKVGDQVESDDPDFPGRYLIADIDDDGLISFDHQTYYDPDDFLLVEPDDTVAPNVVAAEEDVGIGEAEIGDAEVEDASGAPIGAPASIDEINAALDPAPDHQPGAATDPAISFAPGQHVYYYPQGETFMRGPYVVAKCDNGMVYVMDPSAVSDGFAAPAHEFKPGGQAAPTEHAEHAEPESPPADASPEPGLEPDPSSAPLVPAAPAPEQPEAPLPAVPDATPPASKTPTLGRLIDLIRRR